MAFNSVTRRPGCDRPRGLASCRLCLVQQTKVLWAGSLGLLCCRAGPRLCRLKGHRFEVGGVRVETIPSCACPWRKVFLAGGSSCGGKVLTRSVASHRTALGQTFCDITAMTTSTTECFCPSQSTMRSQLLELPARSRLLYFCQF